MIVAAGPVVVDRSVEQLDEAVGDLAAGVESLVDDQMRLCSIGGVNWRTSSFWPLTPVSGT